MLLIHLSSSSISISITEGVSSSKIGLELDSKKLIESDVWCIGCHLQGAVHVGSEQEALDLESDTPGLPLCVCVCPIQKHQALYEMRQTLKQTHL